MPLNFAGDNKYPRSDRDNVVKFGALAIVLRSKVLETLAELTKIFIRLKVFLKRSSGVCTFIIERHTRTLCR